jgi:hypothetical protein
MGYSGREIKSIHDLIGFQIVEDKETPCLGETTMEEIEALAISNEFVDLRVLNNKTFITLEYMAGRVTVWHDDNMVITSVTEG